MENNIPNVILKDNSFVNKWDLDQFQNETPRKMTLHILSQFNIDCIHFVEFLTKETFFNQLNELLENKITKKINLFSFMNYKIYTKTDELMKAIIQIGEDDKKNLKLNKKVNSKYSEVVIIIDNSNIKEQIEEIQHWITEGNLIFKEEYYFPFFLIFSPQDLDLKYFIPSKTFQYSINLNKILNAQKNMIGDIEIFFNIMKKLNILFAYYNELGDEFSFINSNGEEIMIKTVDDNDTSIFINILFLGKTGVGKSKLINLILDEKKSIEGGNGTSTTSKNIITYRKDKIPIRLFDVKGYENGDSVENYLNLLTKFNGNLNASDEYLHGIFYCIKYEATGTVILEVEDKIFEKLIDFNIPILFIITNTPYDANTTDPDSEVEEERSIEKNKIKNVINNSIRAAF